MTVEKKLSKFLKLGFSHCTLYQSQKHLCILYNRTIYCILQVLKLYAWEPSFEQKVREIRNKELATIKKAAYLNAISTFFWTSAPFLVNIYLFQVYLVAVVSYCLIVSL